MFRQLLISGMALMMAVTAQADLRIVTTTTDFADLARQIGGDRVDVHSVMKGPENLHNVIAKPTEMLKLNKADLFVHSGLDAEPWRDNLLKGARNPKVLFGKPGYVDMSVGIRIKDKPTGRIDRSMGDVHAYGNPHYMPSLENAQVMVGTLSHAMEAADPSNANLYKTNAAHLRKELADLEAELKERMKPYAGLKIVTYHAAWLYFTDEYGINVVTTIEPKPAISPSPAELKRTIDTMKANDVKIVVVETYNSLSEATSVAKAAGATVLVLPDHVLGLPEADSYQNLFRTNIDKLINAAKAAGIAPAASAAPDETIKEADDAG